MRLDVRRVFWPVVCSAPTLMSTASGICQIPGDSDIAGLGVRASVYIQACLAGFNLLYILHTRLYNHVPREDDIEAVSTNPGGVPDPDSAAALYTPTANVVDIARRPRSASQQSMPTNFIPDPQGADAESNKKLLRAFLRSNKEYISMIKGLERTLFMVGFAVILSAILESKTAGLTSYHALIILNISQINNWAGFLLLVVRGGFRPSERGGWRSHLFVTRDSLVASIPCMLHAFMMSGLGLYFWSDLSPFLGYAAEAQETPCRPLTYFWVFGAIDVSNNALRRSSLAFYAISAIPVIGLYFLGAIVVFALLALTCGFTVLGFVVAVITMILAILYYVLIYPLIAFILRPLFNTAAVRSMRASLSGPWTFIAGGLRAIYLGLHSRTTALLVGPSYSQVFSFLIGLIFCTPLIYTIVSTELTIRINSVNVEPKAESRWTYGQTLALFSALVALALYLHEQGKLIRKWRKKLLKSKRGGDTPSIRSSPVPEKRRARRMFMERDTQTEIDSPMLKLSQQTHVQ